MGDYLPLYYEVQASISVTKPTAGWKANAYIIFDYTSPTSFKFAGIDVATNKLVMGHRDGTGWIVDKQAPFQSKPDTYYNMLLAVNGLTATLVVNNQAVFSQTYAARVIDGYSYALNWGLVGMGSDNSRGNFDNVTVQVLPPAVTYQNTEDFSDGVADLYTAAKAGAWLVANGRFTANAANATSLAYDQVNLPNVTNLQTASALDLSVVVNTTSRAGVIFDQYAADDFKWAAIDPKTGPASRSA